MTVVLGYTVIENFKKDNLIFETKKQNEQKIEKNAKIKNDNAKKQNKSKSDPKKELAKLQKKILNQIKKKQKIRVKSKNLCCPI